MNIRIDGLTSELMRPAELILQLFFDSVEVNGAKEDEHVRLDCSIHYAEQKNTYEISVTLYDIGQGSTYQAHHASKVSMPNVPKSHTQAQTHALKHSLLKVLEAFTDMTQPWGILTGVRPTKLIHKLVQSGNISQKSLQSLQDQYRIDKQKMKLMERIVDQQLSVIPDLYHLQQDVSIYIGIPFCPTKCAYCTFPAYDIHGLQGSVDDFLSGLHYEMQAVGEWLRQNKMGITSIYFGGGTPTSISAEQMDALYHAMGESFPHLDKVREITVEAGRPDTITPEKLEVLKKHKIDRISINPQSYTQETLDAIGRHHTVDETVEKFWLAREMGMNNINMDLIIGLPGETRADLEHSLEKTAQLMPESLTIHTLSFKRASAMTKNREKYPVAPREEITKMMELAAQWTQANGYQPYYLYRQKNILGNLENVGYALSGQESIYNIIIMEEKQTIIGLGCGASSKLIHPANQTIQHYANPKEPRAYNQNYVAYTEEKIKRLSELMQRV